MAYTVYKNRPNKYACVHRRPCSQWRKHKDVSGRKPPNGAYAEGIATREVAVQEARSTGWMVRFCRFCAP